MPKQPVSVLVLIHTPGLEVLLIERASHAGYWQSVTGSREGDEALAETARREVGEETGIDTTAYRLIDWKLANRFEIFEEWRHRYAAGVTHNLEHVFSLEVPGRVPVRLAADEHTAALWLPWQEAADRVFSWTNRDAILLLAGRCSDRSGAG
jgi:dihydroneopterin triphosphate diphosphatase